MSIAECLPEVLTLEGRRMIRVSTQDGGYLVIDPRNILSIWTNERGEAMLEVHVVQLFATIHKFSEVEAVLQLRPAPESEVQ